MYMSLLFEIKNLYKFKLDDMTMEDILPAGNIAHAQVWSQYTGFLYYVLPGR